jgi:hypothetical protein
MIKAFMEVMKTQGLLVFHCLATNEDKSADNTPPALGAIPSSHDAHVSATVGFSIYGMYRECARRHLPVYMWLPFLNVGFELFFDEPVSLSQLKELWNTIAVICALLLNVVMTLPTSFSYDDWIEINERFQMEGEYHHAFVVYANRFATNYLGHKTMNDFNAPVEKYCDMYSNRVIFS